MKKILGLYSRAIKLSDVTLWPLADLAIRLYMANIFWKSGYLRLQDVLNGQWGSQVTAFTEYHPIPGVPGEIAAIFGVGGEVVLPILLALGLFTRIGAGGLFVMTLVIQFAVPADYGVANDEHYYWLLLLLVPMLRGASLLSVDKIAQKFTCGKCQKQTVLSEEETEKQA